MRLLWLPLALVVAGCAVPAAPLVGPDPSDPSIRVPPTTYRSTIGSYVRYRPVEPRSWREQIERVAPEQKQ